MSSDGKQGIGINGFGRLGQLVLRMALQREGRVAAVNDPDVTIEQMAELLQADDTEVRTPLRSLTTGQGEVRVERGRLVVDGQAIAVYQVRGRAAG